MVDYDKLLSEENVERLKLYSHDSEITKLVGAEMRSIFEKLTAGLKDENGNPINLDDFYFAVSADKTKNAFFISAERTADKKTNIICVNEGFIYDLNNIGQLAALIAHETGHYIWNQLLGGKNTVFQERAADVYSVDLMRRGGYNPLYIIDLLKKYTDLDKAPVPNLNVHGSGRTRIKDVQTYLSVLSNNQGVAFEEIDDDAIDLKWDAFKAQVKQVSEQEDYSTDVESEIKQRFGTKDLTKIPHNDLLKFFKQKLESGNIKTEFHVNNLLMMLGSLDFTTKPDANVVYDLTMTVLDKVEKYKHPNRLGNERDFLKVFLEKASVESRGKFTDLIKYRQDFVAAVNSFDKDGIAENSTEIEKEFYLNRYVVYFSDYDRTKEEIKPQGEKNIGYRMPWQEAFYNSKAFIGEVMRLFGNEEHYKHTYSEELQQYALDDSGVVRAYGDKVKEYNRSKIYEMYERASQEQLEDLRYKLEIANLMAQLGRGTITVSECIQTLKEKMFFIDEKSVFDRVDNVNYDSFFYTLVSQILSDKEYRRFAELANINKNTVLDCHSEYPYQDPRIKEKFELLKQSEYYKYFIAGDPSDEFRKQSGFDKNLDSLKPHEIEQVLLNMFNVDQYVSAYKKHQGILFKFYEYFKEQGYTDYCQHALHQILNRTRRVHHHDDVCRSITEKQTVRERSVTAENKFKLDTSEIRRKAEIDEEIVLKAAIEFSKFSVTLSNPRSEIYTAISQEIKSNKPSVILDNLLRIEPQDTKFPTTSWELRNLLVYEWPRYKHFIGYYIAEYIKRGYKFDISLVYEISDDSHRDKCISKILADWMEDDNCIEKLSLEEKLKLYMFFHKKKLFCAEKANKNNLIKSIVDSIVKSNNSAAVKYAENILSGGDYITGELSRYDEKIKISEFAVQREQLIDFVSSGYAKRLGRDDKTQEYQERAKQVAEYFSGRDGDTGDYRFDFMCAKSILDGISNKVLAQESVARIFEDAATRKITNEQAEKNDFYGRSVQSMMDCLTRSPESALSCIEFLNEKLSDESIARFRNKIKYLITIDSYNDLFSKQNLMILHQSFWSANLEIRSYLMRDLLGAYKGADDKKGIDLVIGLFFDKTSEYYKDAELVLTSLYENLQKHERDLVLAAVTAASQRDENNTMTGGETIGRGLKMFFAAKGAAFIKFGQLLSYMPMLNSDIRKELSTMRDNAKVPTRMELIDMINNTLPASQRNKITHIGKILGAGSFFVSVQVKYDGKDAVIALKRPYTNELTESGMNLICKVIDDLIAADPKYNPLKNIATQARESAKSEIDIKEDYKKYQQAIEIYEGFSVETLHGTYKPDVARWYAHGESENGEYAYKIMEMAGGESMISDTMNSVEKYYAARAYVALELSILLSGQKWDTDRHQGQQNFEYNPAFRNFMIGIFDTGAQMDKAPNGFDKLMLGILLFSLSKANKSDGSMADVLRNIVTKIDKFSEKFNKDTAYIDGVQRGLIALSDIMEYQKEIKDSNGKIIQDSRSLSTKDFIKIIAAIYKSGVVDKTVAAVPTILTIFSNPTQLFQLLEAGSSVSDSIVINYTPVKSRRTKVSEFIKLAEQKISQKMNEGKVFGIKRGLTEKDNSVPDNNKLVMEI